MTLEISGQQLKPCPGWEGNDFHCGRGQPRMIRLEADVCENCSRGMRKRGQRTREEEAAVQRRRAATERRLQRGVDAADAAMTGGTPMMRADPHSEAWAFVADAIQAVEDLREEDLGGSGAYWRRDKLGAADRWQILRGMAGLAFDEEALR